VPTIEITIERLLAAVLQLPQPEFEEFIINLLVYRAKERGREPSVREFEQLGKIDAGLPTKLRNRLNEFSPQSLLKHRASE
jgi:hypothetical protein